MNLVDSHCHLDSAKFAGDLEEVVARARAAGVDQVLAIGTGEGPPDLEAGLRIAERFEGFFATIGVHPHDASKAGGETFARLDQLSRHPKVVALGEIGLDYHYDFSPREVQLQAFRQQLEVARGRLPIVIHTREAWSDTTRILREDWQGNTGIMHCFTGGPEQAKEALDLGFYVSFGGVITFPKSEETQLAARLVPDDLLLVETDAPFLAPVPHRGKRNEPAFMLNTVRKLAEIRGQDAEQIAELTTANFKRLCMQSARLPGAEPSSYTGDSHEHR